MFCVTYMVDDVEQRRHINPDECSFSDVGCCDPGLLDEATQESAFPTTPHPFRTDRVGNLSKLWRRANAVWGTPGSWRSPLGGSTYVQRLGA